jgi:hypothetical protein
MPVDTVSADIALFAFDSSKVIEDTLITKPHIQVSGSTVEIKLADWDMPGKSDGDAITHSEALSVLLGVTTQKKDLAQIMLSSIDAAPLPEYVTEEVAQKVQDIYIDLPIIDAGETLSVLSEELVKDDTLGEYMDISLETENKTTHIATEEISFISGSLIMSFPMRDAAPGLYTVTGALRNPLTGETEYFSQDFVWGVTTINSDQDIYQSGDTANFSLGILDDSGIPVCGADAELSIINNQLSIEEKIPVSDTGFCHLFDPANRLPDYTASTTFAQPGIYTLSLSVDNGNGVRTFEKNITVTETPRFIISRDIATRLYPFGMAPATLTIEFFEDFEGTLQERLPRDFVL